MVMAGHAEVGGAGKAAAELLKASRTLLFQLPTDGHDRARAEVADQPNLAAATIEMILALGKVGAPLTGGIIGPAVVRARRDRRLHGEPAGEEAMQARADRQLIGEVELVAVSRRTTAVGGVMEVEVGIPDGERAIGFLRQSPRRRDR